MKNVYASPTKIYFRPIAGIRNPGTGQSTKVWDERERSTRLSTEFAVMQSGALPSCGGAGSSGTAEKADSCVHFFLYESQASSHVCDRNPLRPVFFLQQRRRGPNESALKLARTFSLAPGQKKNRYEKLSSMHTRSTGERSATLSATRRKNSYRLNRLPSPDLTMFRFMT